MPEQPMRDPLSEDSSPPSAEERQPQYDFDAIDLDSTGVHANVVRLVGEDKRVLELGPATGYMTRALRERGCRIVGIEIDSDMAREAEPYCERMIVGDIDTLDLEAELRDERFDVIVAADVLEHLKDPLAALHTLRGLLMDGGELVISVPNVAHGSVRLALLTGHFDYRDLGLMDHTHLRFFTRETLGELLDQAEFGIAELHRHELNIDASEVPFDADAVPPDLQEALEHDRDARTYQFVVRAVPMNRDGLRDVQRQLRELSLARADAERDLDEQRRANEQLVEANERLAKVNEQLDAISTREGHLRNSLVQAHDQLLRRDAEMERLRERLESERETHAAALGEVKLALARREEEARLLRVRLDRILQTPPHRAYAALRHLPGMRRVAARRQAGFNEAAHQSSNS